MKYTKEALQNTWGVVESKEHAEFIIGLAELHGFDAWMPSDGLIRITHFVIYGGEIKMHSHDCANAVSRMNLKQITIPLPPKAVKNGWPQVGDKVLTSIGEGVVKLLGDKPIHCLVDIGGVYSTFKVEALKKPKTPEEEVERNLTDLIMRARDAEADDVTIARSILSKYNITKKDKGDE